MKRCILKATRIQTPGLMYYSPAIFERGTHKATYRNVLDFRPMYTQWVGFMGSPPKLNGGFLACKLSLAIGSRR